MWSIIPQTPTPVAQRSRALPVTNESLHATTVPCQSCSRNSFECSWLGPDRRTGISVSLDNGNGNGNDMMIGIDGFVTNEMNAVLPSNHHFFTNETNTVLPNNDGQQSWFQPVQDAWSLPVPPVGLDASFPNELNAGGLAHGQWILANEDVVKAQSLPLHLKTVLFFCQQLVILKSNPCSVHLDMIWIRKIEAPHYLHHNHLHL